MAILAIEDTIVAEGRVEARVRVTDPAFVRTSAIPEFPARALALLPGLVRHRCECGSARGIEAELADTETAHALEHIALEIMVLTGSPRTLRGQTMWDFAREGRGVFTVSVEYDDARVAASAIELAGALIEHLCGGPALPDFAARVSSLREERGAR